MLLAGGTWVWLFFATGAPGMEPMEVCCFPDKLACETYRREFRKQDWKQQTSTNCTRRWREDA